MSKKERVLSWILLVLCAAPILTAVVGVQFLPDQIPVHTMLPEKLTVGAANMKSWSWACVFR